MQTFAWYYYFVVVFVIIVIVMTRKHEFMIIYQQLHNSPLKLLQDDLKRIANIALMTQSYVFKEDENTISSANDKGIKKLVGSLHREIKTEKKECKPVEVRRLFIMHYLSQLLDVFLSASVRFSARLRIPGILVTSIIETISHYVE